MIEVRDNKERNRFEADVDGVPAVLDYVLSGDTITFTHAHVPSHHQGQGVGEALARTAMDSARDRGLKVVPQCPFIAEYIKRHSQYQDLVRE
jgi:predicted GNAT family acetyltransferase